MKLLIGVLIWEAVFITAILISKPRTKSDPWLGTCIIASVLAVSGVPFLLIAVTKLMDDTRPFWLAIGLSLFFLVTLQVGRVNSQQQSENLEEQFEEKGQQ